MRRCRQIEHWLLAVVAVMAGLALSGCTTTKAATVIAGPPLMVPPAPPRELTPPEAEPIAATASGPGTPVTSVPRVQPSLPTVRRPAQTRTEVEPKGEVPPSAAAIAGPGPSEPVRELRPAPAELGGAEDRIKALLTQADQDRRSVTYTRLSVEARKNFDESKRFSEQASEKLKERNITFALYAADKAATLAAALVGR